MQCHRPGHRAPARCASALLAAGVLLATAAEQADGSQRRPAADQAAVGYPQAVGPLPTTDPPAALTPPPVPRERATPKRTAVPRSTATKKAAAAKSPTAVKKPAAVKKQAAPPKRKAPPGHSKAGKSAKASKSTKPALRKPVRHSAPKPTRKNTKPTHSSPQAHLPAAGNAMAAKAIREALSLLGTPYRWGGTSKAGGFDCSGFTQHVWAAAGVKIPRTVGQQARAGTAVPLNKAQPGDLVVFYPSRHHVGIFVGNGLVVDSPHSGSVVRFDPIRSMPVSVVVRPYK